MCQGNGIFTYKGKDFECPDDSYGHPVLRLSSLYFLANIPIQYQKLVWDEWPDDTEIRKNVKAMVSDYIEMFPGWLLNGVGMSFWSKMIGTGKTWAATTVLKELVKRGYDGWWVSFRETTGYYDHPNSEYLIHRMQEAQILVLDEVSEPIMSDRQKNFYAEKLEDLIRPRTNANLPTIITTNLTPDQLNEIYPRVFSLISAKNFQVTTNGQDARVSDLLFRRNLEEPHQPIV